jgi:hypothetical protein
MSKAPPKGRVMVISVAGRRRDAYTDAAERKRAKARDRQRKFRRHRRMTETQSWSGLWWTTT